MANVGLWGRREGPSEPRNPCLFRLRSAGNNWHGQLGVGPGVREVHEPQPLKLARRWACLSIGVAHSAAVTGQGEVYTWGLNSSAQLGIPSGPGPSVDTPRVMELLGGWNVRYGVG